MLPNTINIKEILQDEFKTNDFIRNNRKFVINIIKSSFPTVLNTYEKEDYIQEGLLSFYKAMTKYDDSGEFKFFAYAATVIRNDLFKRVSRQQNKLHQFNKKYPVVSVDKIYVDSDTNLIDMYNDLTNTVEDQVINKDTNLELPKLKPEYKEILKLKMDGKSHADIARIMGCSRENIRQKMENIRNKVKEYKVS